MRKLSLLRVDPFRQLERFVGEGYTLRVGMFRAIVDVDQKEQGVFVRRLDYRGRVYK